jgi:nucleoside-diphosphate-sugar epimerase
MSKTSAINICTEEEPLMPGAYLDRKSVQGHKFLITGAAGFFGSHFVRELVKKSNTQVVGLDLRSKEATPFSLLHTPPLPPAKFTFIPADIGQRVEIEKVLKEFRPDYVVHLAAESQVANAAKDAKGTMKTNVEGTRNILAAIAAQFSRSNFPGTVLASSERAYGPGNNEITEDSPRRPQGPYATSKSIIIDLAAQYARQYDMPLVTTCCVNIYGQGDLNWGRIIPTYCRQLFLDRPIIVQRNIDDKGKIRAARKEFLYIEAALAAYRLMVKNSKNPKLWGQHFNFGTGKSISISALARTMLEITGKNAEIQYCDGPISMEAPNQHLSSKKALALGWAGETTPLYQGLKKTYEWYSQLLRNHPDIVESRC